MQHHYVHECVNRTLQDIQGNDRPKFVVVFGGDFKQILPVIVKGLCAQIVGACIQHSYLWHSIEVLHLTQNMRLNTGNQVECEFAEWQLRVGHGHFTDLDSRDITLPDHFWCAENTVQSLIDTIYPGVSTTPQPDEYFADHTILCSKNDDVHDLNKKILDTFSGHEKVYFSADSIPPGEGNGKQGDLMYLVEYLNTI